MFREAAKYKASCHVHTLTPVWFRRIVWRPLKKYLAAAITGAPLHVVHITSMAFDDTPRVLE